MVTATHLRIYLEPLRGLLLLFSQELSDTGGIIGYGMNLIAWRWYSGTSATALTANASTRPLSAYPSGRKSRLFGDG